MKSNHPAQYHGKPCTTCGGTLRWRCNWQCVPCNRDRARERQRLRRENHIAYYGDLLKNRRRQALKAKEARHGQVSL